MIKLNLVEVPPITRIDGAVRMYKTPNGDLYPSVSTVLSKGIENPHIDAWRKRVGEVEADKISKIATDRGSLIHDNIERHILGEITTFTPIQFQAREMFSQALPIINALQEVRALETQLWSDKLRCAGTVDCCAVYADELYVIDWKTSGRIKSREDISSYFMQTAAYAYMLYERCGLPIANIMIVMMTQDDGVIVFNEKVKTWLPKFIEVRNRVQL